MNTPPGPQPWCLPSLGVKDNFEQEEAEVTERENQPANVSAIRALNLFRISKFEFRIFYRRGVSGGVVSGTVFTFPSP